MLTFDYQWMEAAGANVGEELFDGLAEPLTFQMRSTVDELIRLSGSILTMEEDRHAPFKSLLVYSAARLDHGHMVANGLAIRICAAGGRPSDLRADFEERGLQFMSAIQFLRLSQDEMRRYKSLDLEKARPAILPPGERQEEFKTIVKRWQEIV